MTFIIVGGSSGLGRALAEKFAAEGQDLILISKDQRDISALASHLSLTYGSLVTAIAMNLSDKHMEFDKIDQALLRHAPLKGLLLPVGLNDKKDQVGLDENILEDITQVNYLSPIKLVNHYLPSLCENSGVVVGFGSVATARGRRKNAAYAAAKSALVSYFDSLKYYAANNNVYSQFYVLGYLDTNLAFTEKLLLPRADPSKLAQLVFNRLSKKGRLFYPFYWYVLYRVVQLLPWTIFKRLSF